MDVTLRIASLYFRIPEFANMAQEYRINAVTLGDAIAEVPKLLPFSLMPCVEQGKGWVIKSAIKKINGKVVDVHFTEPRSHLLTRDNHDRTICPKHDLSAKIPFRGIVYISSHPVC